MATETPPDQLPDHPDKPAPDHPSPSPKPGPSGLQAQGRSASLAESVAGEEDPGAGVDMARAAMAPGDQAPPGTPGTGEGICPRCGGTGQVQGGEGAGEVPCPECEGTGRLVVGIGGA